VPATTWGRPPFDSAQGRLSTVSRAKRDRLQEMVRITITPEWVGLLDF